MAQPVRHSRRTLITELPRAACLPVDVLFTKNDDVVYPGSGRISVCGRSQTLLTHKCSALGAGGSLRFQGALGLHRKDNRQMQHHRNSFLGCNGLRFTD